MALIEIAWRSLGRKIGKIIAIIILNAIAIILLGGIIFNRDKLFEDRYYCEKVFGDMEKKYVMSGFSEHLDEILSVEGLDKFTGLFKSICMWENVNNLQEIQYKIKKEELEEFNISSGLIVYEADNNFFEFFDNDLISGKKLDKNMLDSDITYIYLGYAYKTIEVGTRYEYSLGDEKYIVEVAGIFEEGQYVAVPSETAVTIGDTSNISLNLDNEIIVINSNLSDNRVLCGEYFFTIKDDADYKSVVGNITKTLEKYDEVINYTTLNAIFDEVEKSNIRFISIIEGLMWIVVICSILISSCIVILDIQKNQRMYGIICANGASSRDVAVSIILENGIVIILSVMLSVIVALTQDKYIFSNEVFVNVTLYKVLASCVILMMLTSVLPIIYISRMDIKKMIQGEAI